MTDDPIPVPLVDDEPPVAATTSEYLEHAADRLAEGDVDGIVSDFEMSGPDGIQFLEAVRDRGHDNPFVPFTGVGSA